MSDTKRNRNFSNHKDSHRSKGKGSRRDEIRQARKSKQRTEEFESSFDMFWGDDDVRRR